MTQSNLQKLIEEGKFNYVNSGITDKNFPDFDKLPNEKTELIHFDKQMSSDNVLLELKNKGYRPANLKELLEFGKANPEEQRKYPIVALGSVWPDWYGGGVPCLWGGAYGRGLDLDWYEHDWRGRYRFLAVRESEDVSPKEHSCEYKDKLEKINLNKKKREIKDFADPKIGTAYQSWKNGYNQAVSDLEAKHQIYLDKIS